jgi:5-methylcytosine-specific restriction endonuclease McrA
MQSTRTCSVDGCAGDVIARGWCSKHYQKWRKYGDPMEGRGQDFRKAVDFEDGTRLCSGCYERQPLEVFDKDPGGTLGRKSRCKACRSAQMRALYASNREEKLASVREYRNANRDVVRESDSRRYARHREKRIALATESAHLRRSRILQKSNDRGISRHSLRKRHGDNCCYCGRSMSFRAGTRGVYNPGLATIEHIVPISKGGSHTWGNVTLACWECNIRRGNRDAPATSGGAHGGADAWLHGASDLDEAAS